MLVRTDVYGSPEFVLTWKAQAMPWGRQICRLLARARRTRDSDYSLWPTPAARDGAHGGCRVNDGKRGAGLKEALTGWATPRVATNGGHGNPERATDGKARLEDQVHGWATPTGRDHKDGGSTLDNTPVNGLLGRQVHGYPTPCATDGSKAPQRYGRGNLTLPGIVRGWASPTAQDGERGSAPPRPQDSGVPLSQQVAQTEKRGALAPEFSRWLMGFPAEWGSCVPTATRSCRRLRPSS